MHRSVIHNGSWKLERCAQQVVTVCMSCLDGFKESFVWLSMANQRCHGSAGVGISRGGHSA